MNKIYKILSLAVLLSLATTARAHDLYFNGIYYNITSETDLTVEVTYAGSSAISRYNEYKYTGAVTIPSSVTYKSKTYSVTSIGGAAFYDCWDLTSITIPSSVTSIGGSAFYDCWDLTSVTINSNSVLSKDYSSSSSLEDVFGSQVQNYVIGEGVTRIGNYAFYGCSGLTSVTIPSSVTSIGSDAFSGCTGLTSVTIPSSVTSIGSGAFHGCSGLTSVTIPSSVTSIGSSAFSDCYGLTSITIPSSVTSIGSSAFEWCSRLKSITIPSSVTSIGSYAFRECSRLKSITIPSSVTSIGNYAFRGCSGLTSITIPSSVTTIGNYAFQDCNSLTSVTINSNSVLSKNYSSSSSLEDVFGSQVQNYVIGEGVTRIGNYAFYGCSGLTSVTIPSSVTSIGDWAFSGCSGLTSVTIPSSVTSIGNTAFSGCSGLTSVTIPSSVTSIGDEAFYACSRLTSIKVDEGNKVYDSREGCNAIIETATNTLIAGCNSTIIPSSVTKIGSSAFSGCTRLTSVTIPSSVTSIGSSAFRGCSGLTSITIPSSVTSIGDWAFYGCSGLTSVTIPSSVTSIGSSAFSDCYGLTSITIPSSVTSIGNEAFRGCSGLTSITIPSSVTSIGNSAFRDSGLKSITIPSSVTSIGSDAFSGCSPTCRVEAGSFASLWAHSQGLRCAEPFVKGYSHTASSIRLGFYPFAENVHVSSFTVNGKEMLSSDYSVTMLGLLPNNHYSFQYVVRTDARTFTFTEGYRTDALTLTTEQPKVISVGNVIVSAQSNLDDAEEKVGFEWRRTDWTDDFASNTGEAYLFEGTMEGYIRNLYAEKLWKYRPYYEAGDGTRYYGDWVGIDPTNASYFEPTVHTYATVEVKGSTAAVKGYVQRGTDDVAEQGFAYWKTEAGAKGREDARRISSIPDDATTVVARGKVMTATLTGLEAGTEYTYVAYVITDEGETFYGEEQTFRTDVATGIEETTAAPVQSAVPQGVFNLSGQRLSAPQKGLNIINGKKVLIK